MISMKCTAVGLAVVTALILVGVNRGVAQEPPVAPADDAAPVTFNKHIAPLVFKHCAVCHRPGEVAPFSLLTYADAKKRAKQLQTVTADRFMPPWKSVAGHGSFLGERRLSAEEIAQIARWVKQGAPEGAAADLPAAPKFPEGWQLGKPDVVVTMPAAYKIPADGPDIYRNFVFAFELPKGKFIRAAEYRPSNRRVVHHAVLAVDVTDRARKQQTDPAMGFKGSANVPGQLFPGSTGTWTPGRDPLPLPDGLTMPWKPGADLVLQLHLHPSGKPEEEQSSIGFYLTDQPPQRSMVDLLLLDKKIDIPPGERSYRTRDELTLPIDVEVRGLFPHMHLLGKQIKVTAFPPHGEPISLLRIDDWDFNWQTFYQCAEPVKLAAGTRVVLDAIHDNSAENIHNPSQPPERVVWGEETRNEMTVAFLQVVPMQEADFPKLGANLRDRMLGTIRASGSKAAAP
jgi:mono/diheme cytochrome c family protein